MLLIRGPVLQRLYTNHIQPAGAVPHRHADAVGLLAGLPGHDLRHQALNLLAHRHVQEGCSDSRVSCTWEVPVPRT